MNLAGSLGGLVGGYFQQQNARQQGRLQGIQGQMQLSQAIRNRQMTDFDARLGQRRAEEAASQSGVYDPEDKMNVGTQSVQRVKDRNAIAQQGAAEQEMYANKQMTQIKKAIQRQRQQYYANMALHMFEAGLGGYGMAFPGGTTGAQIAAQSHSNATGLDPSMFNFK